MSEETNEYNSSNATLLVTSASSVAAEVTNTVILATKLKAEQTIAVKY